ncbi:MAG: pyridoxal-phosphate dependent enzyme [Fluviicola sp.]|nr:pyridoxal-phosphate dependent enzyme [Fluviicola sp.]
MLYSTENSILQEIILDNLNERNIQLFIKRDDLIDPFVSGNKWRKLKFNVEQTLSQKKEGVLTFGGAFSNHLVATAAACKQAGIKSVGIVRGDELTSDSNETLRKCVEFGMDLEFVSRSKYDLRYDRIYKEELNIQFPNYYQVPEGGANFYGMMGCQEILSEIPIDYDSIFVAQGTTTTSCGLLLGMKEESSLRVVPVLKNYDSISEMRQLLNYSIFDEELTDDLVKKVVVHSESHFGGYAKYTKELLTFIQDFYAKTQVPLDPIYTGKVMITIFEEIEKGNLDNQKIVFIHTGGIQGAKAIQEKEGIKLYV